MEYHGACPISYFQNVMQNSLPYRLRNWRAIAATIHPRGRQETRKFPVCQIVLVWVFQNIFLTGQRMTEYSLVVARAQRSGKALIVTRFHYQKGRSHRV